MSTKFNEYKGLSLTNISDEILTYWKTNQIFQKSIETREGNEPFVFFEGPPSANGLPGIHHVLGRTIKDIYPRYKTMKGFKVQRKAGWDTHGLPVELGVEKELGITKEDIGIKITIEEYNEACKKAVMKYTNIWNDLTERIGYWVDMENPYITYTPKYMETVWWLLGEIYKKKLLYKGYTIQPYSPKAGTGLSSHEINQPGCYQDVTDTTIVAQFKTINTTLPTSLQKYNEVHILAWTTTPWTLPSNTALTVGPKIKYVLVRTFNQYTHLPINVILAENLVNKQFGKKFNLTTAEENLTYNEGDKTIPYMVCESFTGKELEGIRYEQLLPWAVPYQNPENAFRVITGDFVTTEDGTGIVHTAPTFGADDAFVAKNATPEVPPMLVLDDNGNPVPLVDLQGKFTKHVGPHAGKYVKNEYYNEGEAPEKSVDVEIAIQLKEENKAFNVEKYKHSYPHCWRTDKPVLYYPLDSWFIKVSEVKNRMFDLNNTINWKPKSTGEGRFGNWLQNANDWNLSRSRYWGIPLPIWRTEDGTEEVIISSIAELKQAIANAKVAGIQNPTTFDGFEIGNMSDENYNQIDLHKNVVDAITLISPSGKPMKRESDLIDVWFDSGAMPYAQQHYPFENKETIDNNEFFPANFIAEGVDQTRGWFYTLHAIATMVFDSVAYKNVVSNGLVLDKHGKKMSKRLGNGIDPFSTMDTYGPDATRWYMISNANPWDNLKFDLEGVDEVRRKFFGTLHNTYSFFALYANVDGFTNSEAPVKHEDRPEIDRWILSELNTLILKTDKFYNEFEATRATREIQNFVNENLSNWFVRLSRRRFWKGDYSTDKISAYQTLYTCLLTIAKLSAPVAPFFADKLYLDLTAINTSDNTESVHLTTFPVADESFIDKALERKMQKAQVISSMVLSLRKKEMIKVRQPLQKIMVPILDQQDKTDIEAVQNLILSEVNVKELVLLEDASGIIVKNIKPNFKVLGPRFGKDMKLVAAEVQKFNQDQINELERKGKIAINIGENLVDLNIQEVEISSQDIDGWLVANQGNLTVALDVTISETLKDEGIARELINRIQNFRKDSGLEVTDKIQLSVLKQEALAKAIQQNESYIKSETLTNEINIVDSLENGLEIEFDDITSKIYIHKI